MNTILTKTEAELMMIAKKLVNRNPILKNQSNRNQHFWMQGFVNGVSFECRRRNEKLPKAGFFKRLWRKFI